MNAQRWMWMAWPAFLTACLQEMLVFSVLDPVDIPVLHGPQLSLSPLAIYSLAFLAFWLLSLVASGLTLQLAQPAADVNGAGPSVPPDTPEVLADTLAPPGRPDRGGAAL